MKNFLWKCRYLLEKHKNSSRYFLLIFKVNTKFAILVFSFVVGRQAKQKNFIILEKCNDERVTYNSFCIWNSNYFFVKNFFHSYQLSLLFIFYFFVTPKKIFDGDYLNFSKSFSLLQISTTGSLSKVYVFHFILSRFIIIGDIV